MEKGKYQSNDKGNDNRDEEMKDAQKKNVFKIPDTQKSLPSRLSEARTWLLEQESLITLKFHLLNDVQKQKIMQKLLEMQEELDQLINEHKLIEDEQDEQVELEAESTVEPQESNKINDFVSLDKKVANTKDQK